MKTLKEAILEIKKVFDADDPQAISSTWINTHCPASYRYIWKHVRNENDEIDWDKVTRKFDRKYQKRWTWYRTRTIKEYSNPEQVQNILDKNRDKLYVLFAPVSEEDKKLQHILIIKLVRLGQCGNVEARDHLIEYVTFITDDWIDKYPQMYRWKGYADEVPDKIVGCMKRYRYTGSYLGYLFRTLQYSAYGKPPLVSLDDKILDGSMTRIEKVEIEDHYRNYL